MLERDLSSMTEEERSKWFSKQRGTMKACVTTEAREITSTGHANVAGLCADCACGMRKHRIARGRSAPATTIVIGGGGSFGQMDSDQIARL